MTGVTTMKMMNGKTNKATFKSLFESQTSFQNIVLERGLYDQFKSKGTLAAPIDDIKLASYHIQQLMSEIGEVLDADKRWKNYRNQKYDKDNKLEEIADCFIVLMNVAMFSGFNGDELVKAITTKINENMKRIN